MNVNLIITCNNTECKYNNEGECGKPLIQLNDTECLELNKESADE